MGLEALPDDQAAEIIAKREALGKMVLDLFENMKAGERMIANLAKEQGCAADDFAVAEAAITFEWKEYGRDYRLSLRVDGPEEPAAEPFLDQLRRVNLARYEAWVDGADAGIMFDALELGGEVGELLNVVKKLEREQRGWRGSRAAPSDFADECADVLICLDKLARRGGVDLRLATIDKFNATSEKVGLPHRLEDVEG